MLQSRLETKVLPSEMPAHLTLCLRSDRHPGPKQANSGGREHLELRTVNQHAVARTNAGCRWLAYPSITERALVTRIREEVLARTKAS